jgi:hypothetical protein
MSTNARTLVVLRCRGDREASKTSYVDVLASWNGPMFQHPAAVPYNQRRRINHCSLHHNCCGPDNFQSRNNDSSSLICQDIFHWPKKKLTAAAIPFHSIRVIFSSVECWFRCPAIRAMGNVRGTPCGRRRDRSCCRVHPQSHLSQNDVSSGTADSWLDKRAFLSHPRWSKNVHRLTYSWRQVNFNHSSVPTRSKSD